jgi:hypothetical protein
LCGEGGARWESGSHAKARRAYGVSGRACGEKRVGELAPEKGRQAAAVEGLRLFGRVGRGSLSRVGAEGVVGRVPGRG